jgi:hypothetical protein
VFSGTGVIRAHFLTFTGYMKPLSLASMSTPYTSYSDQLIVFCEGIEISWATEKE